jgi:hypothetical protein
MLFSLCFLELKIKILKYKISDAKKLPFIFLVQKNLNYNNLKGVAAMWQIGEKM